MDVCQRPDSSAVFFFDNVEVSVVDAAPLLAPLLNVSQKRISFHSRLRAKISNLGVGCVLREISADRGCCMLE